MADKTGIQWTDATWNPTVGCDRISPGCARCYAKDLHDKRHKAFLAGKKVAPQYAQPFEVLQTIEKRLDAPLHWREPRKIFVNSVSDLFHEAVPDAFIDRVFAVMALAPQHTFQVLTKRADRMRGLLLHPNVRPHLWETAQHLRCDPRFAGASRKNFGQWPLPNVWLGVSVENQATYDARIGHLLRTPAAVRFLSYEPALGPLDLRMGGMSLPEYSPHDPLPTIDWLICGGESGKDARPFDVAWARSILAQCQAAGVACFVKQLGRRPITTDSDWRSSPTANLREGAEVPGTQADVDAGCSKWGTVVLPLRDSHGGDWDEWPADLRVREFPSAAALR